MWKNRGSGLIERQKLRDKRGHKTASEKRKYIPNDNWDNGSSFMSSYRIPELELHKTHQYIGWNCVYLLGILREITNLLLI